MALHVNMTSFFQQWGFPQNRHKTYGLINSANGELVDEGGKLGLNLERNSLYIEDRYHARTSVGINLLLDAARKIDSLYATTTYRSVLNHPSWLQLYQSSLRNIQYINHGNTLQVQNEQTVPCHECGIVLPIDHITIDHQKPQTGGETQAILKVLRNIGLGLTHAGPSGAKGVQVQALLANQTLTPVPTKLGKTANPPDPAPKYTLTMQGIAFVSAVAAANCTAELKRSCMHSMINLAPHCFRCNLLKNNGRLDLTGINF